MESVLNVGLNDTLVHSLAATTGSPKFAYDTYRRFIQQYSVHVDGADPDKFSAIVSSVMAERQLTSEDALTTFDYQKLVTEFKKISSVPEDPWEQLYSAVAAVYRSWDSQSVAMYRDIHGIPWVSSRGIPVLYSTLLLYPVSCLIPTSYFYFLLYSRAVLPW